MKTITRALQTTLLLLVSVFITVFIYGQPYEIRAVNKGQGNIGVEVRVVGGNAPTPADFVTDLTFGLKWSMIYNVELVNTITTTYNIQKAGSQTSKNGFYFQSFYAEPVGFNLPSNWPPGTWVEIMSIQNTRTGAGTGTFEVCEPGFDPTTDPNIGINFNDYIPSINGAAMDVVLPVNITKFLLTPANRTIKVQWLTENEQDCKGFEVQRSSEPGNNFRRIGWLDGRATDNGRGEYTFDDKEIVPKLRYYYRLKKINKDDSFIFSEIKAVIYDYAYRRAISISPNPATRVLEINFKDIDYSGPAQANILNSEGAVLISKEVSLRSHAKVDINVRDLSHGSYIIVIRSKSGLVYSQIFQKR